MPKTKTSIKTIPYRNTMKKNKDFVLDKKVTYKQNKWIEPRGFWYQINDCAKKWNVVDYGKYIYKVDIDLSNILVIKNYQDYLKFNKKFSMLKTYKYSESVKESNVSNSDPSIEKRLHINWEKVSKKYSGIEIKNYNRIKTQLTKDYIRTKVESWLEYFDFSQGCIWDLKAVKSVNYCCKFSKQLQLNSKLINSKSGSKSSKSKSKTSVKSKRAVKKSNSKKTKKKIKDDC
jgi:hypothetical protein